MSKQTDLFRDTEEGKEISGGLSLDQAIDLSVESLKFAEDFDTWMIGFSGGKDSSATVTLIDYLIKQGRIKRPKNLIVCTNDTLMELPPLEIAAGNILSYLKSQNLQPSIRGGAIRSERFFTLLLGIGYPPPNSRFTWCRDRMKLKQVEKLAELVKSEYGDSFVTIDGVRIGESAIRDKAIYASCRKDDGECGSTLIRTVSTGLKLSPIAHWRVCHVADWLVLADVQHGYPTLPVLEIYGADISDGLEDLSARTGCVGCPLVTAQRPEKPSQDKALLRVLKLPQWSHLEPMLELSEIYWKLHFNYENRHVWDSNKKGQPKRHGRPGCLTIEARKWALERILDIESRVNRKALELGRKTIQIIRPEELQLIRELHDAEAYPERWDASDPVCGDHLEPVIVNGQLDLFSRDEEMEGDRS